MAKRLRYSEKQERMPSEQRAQRVSWCLSIVESPDENAVREAERIVDETCD